MCVWQSEHGRTLTHKLGKLAVKLLPTTGGSLTLDNMETYPTVRANEDIAALIFKLHDGSNTELIIPGNEPTSNNTVSIDNPFIKTSAQANTAAAVILQSYGGNMFETVGRRTRRERICADKAV